MFYKRIDLVKLYEAYENVGLNEQETVTSNPPQVNVEGAENTVDSNISPDGGDAVGGKGEKVKIAQGNTYAFPMNRDTENKLHALADQGTGEFRTSEPLKSLLGGRNSGAAEMMIGGNTLPVYLIIKIVANKEEQKSISVNLVEKDRCYVLLLITPDGLTDILDNLGGITNSIKLGVKTPMIGKSGNLVEHTLQVWDDEVVGEEEPDEEPDQMYNEEPEDAADEDIMDAEPSQPSQVSNTGTNQVSVDMDAAMEAPGTAAGFESNESKVPSFSEYLKRNQ